MLRFGSELAGRWTVGFSLDGVVFIVLGIAALLLLPAADCRAARHLFERLAPLWNRALRRALRITEPTANCPRTARIPLQRI